MQTGRRTKFSNSVSIKMRLRYFTCKNNFIRQFSFFKELDQWPNFWDRTFEIKLKAKFLPSQSFLFFEDFWTTWSYTLVGGIVCNWWAPKISMRNAFVFIDHRLVIVVPLRKRWRKTTLNTVSKRTRSRRKEWIYLLLNMLLKLVISYNNITRNTGFQVSKTVGYVLVKLCLFYWFLIYKQRCFFLEKKWRWKQENDRFQQCHDQWWINGTKVQGLKRLALDQLWSVQLGERRVVGRWSLTIIKLCISLRREKIFLALSS